jgi:Trypsin-like peptidase domain
MPLPGEQERSAYHQETFTQSAPPRNDIPAIAKAASGTIVSIVMSDKDGKLIAQGSGFLVSKDGKVVTNYHVISEGSSAIVKFPDGAFYVVDGVLASDKTRDVAIIKAHGENFRTLTLGNSDRVQVGEEVVAIGNPLSLESTVSNGIVSAIRRIEEEGGKFLQVTAPISPGSSGGPLFNMAGEVIGITALKFKGGENLNFAIPINDAKRLLFAFPAPKKLLALPDQPGTKEASNKDFMHIKSYDFAGQVVIVQYGNQLIQAKVTRTVVCAMRPDDKFDSDKDCEHIPPIAGRHVGQVIPSLTYISYHLDPDCAYTPYTYVWPPSTSGTITFVVEFKTGDPNRCSLDDKKFQNETWEIQKVEEANP